MSSSFWPSSLDKSLVGGGVVDPSSVETKPSPLSSSSLPSLTFSKDLFSILRRSPSQLSPSPFLSHSILYYVIFRQYFIKGLNSQSLSFLILIHTTYFIGIKDTDFSKHVYECVLFTSEWTQKSTRMVVCARAIYAGVRLPIFSCLSSYSATECSV